MANPQKENGYVVIANEIIDALIRYRLPGEQRQILDAIFRKTYGYNKKRDAIALSQFVKMTGLKKPNIIRAIRGLLSKKIIFVIKKDNASAHVYEFNKNYDKWVPLSKKITLSKKIMTVIKKDNPSLSKVIPTKDNTTKDNTTKDKELYVEQPVKIKIPYKKIIEYLNQKTDKNFLYTNKETQNKIKARWNQGFRLDDFFHVIDVKSQKWLTNPKMIDFLRPQTLFGTKFEGYLNENIHPLQGKVSDKTIQSIEALNEWEREENEKQKTV